MRFYDVSFFIDKDNPIVPSIECFGREPTLRLGPSRESPSQVTIFFDSVQSVTNFKNEVLQSYETFLKEKSSE